MSKPWVLYNRDCKVCRRAVWVTGFLLGRGYVNFVPLQKDWVRKLFSLTADTLLEEMKLLTVDRSKLGGADAVLYLAGQVFWMKPIVAIMELPLIRDWVHKTYRWVARKRYCLEGGCALPGIVGDTGRFQNRKQLG